MPWTQPGGSPENDSGNGPWGRGNGSGNGGNNRGGGGRGGPPDLEEWLRRAQRWLQSHFPTAPGGHGPSAGGIVLIALGLVVVWLLTGIYQVGPDEQGVVLRFGQFVARTGPGINYHLPWPIETVKTPKVTVEHQIDIGETQGSDLPSESLMLTGDENIVDINFTVYWVVKNAEDYLFNVESPDDNMNQTIKAVAESAMREVVGETALEPILTQDREPIQLAVRKLMQKTLDSYGAGVEITRVQMQKADPPAEVIAAYRDVQAARADQEAFRNEGETYANKVIPAARGQAAQIVQNAQAYKQRVTAEAEGDAKRFLAVLGAYRLAPDVTRKRIYLDTMSKILAGTEKVVIDPAASKSGVMPYLPLPQLKAGQQSGVSVSEPAPSASKGAGQ